MDTAETQSYEEKNEKTIVTESLINLSENSSASRIRTVQLNEYCKHAENNLKVLKTKIQSLSATNNEAIKTRNELLARQKINSINLTSLFQTRNEFYNYKCDAKTEYVEEEVTMKNKRLKYNVFTTCYINNWESVEREHKKMPMASEMFMIQHENSCLNSESTRLLSLFKKTENGYFREISDLQKNLIQKTLEFVKEYRIYSHFLNINQKIRNITIKIEKLTNLQKSVHARHKAIILKKRTLEWNIENERNFAKDSFCMHLKEFDTMVIPMEILPLEVLDIPKEGSSLIHSKEMLMNLETLGKSDLSYKKSLRVPDKDAINIDNAPSNENTDSSSVEIKDNTRGENVQANDVIVNTVPVSLDVQREGSADDVSLYWKPTQNANVVEVEETESKVDEGKNCKQREKILDGGKNCKKKKYSSCDIDDAISAPPSEKCGNPKPSGSVQTYRAEEGQLENTETAPSTRNNEPTIRTGSWNGNQVSSASHDEKREENKFSFFSGGGDSERTKTATVPESGSEGGMNLRHFKARYI